MPNFSDDEEEDADGQKEDVVGEVEVGVADDDGGRVVLRDDVEDAVFVGQRDEKNDDKNL